MIGKRIGFGKEPMPPHSLTMTMIGASLLWVGWFGFNAGSNLEANGLTALAFINTFVATAAAAAVLGHGRAAPPRHALASGRGDRVRLRVSSRSPRLRALPRPMARDRPRPDRLADLLLLRLHGEEQASSYDDSLDVFGVHCVGGIVGAIGTGIVADPALGGQGWFDYTVFPAVAGDYDMGAQVITQIKAVLLTLVWSGVVSPVLFYVIKTVFGLRPSAEDERQGLDQTSHGETRLQPVTTFGPGAPLPARMKRPSRHLLPPGRNSARAPCAPGPFRLRSARAARTRSLAPDVPSGARDRLRRGYLGRDEAFTP